MERRLTGTLPLAQIRRLAPFSPPDVVANPLLDVRDGSLYRRDRRRRLDDRVRPFPFSLSLRKLTPPPRAREASKSDSASASRCSSSGRSSGRPSPTCSSTARSAPRGSGGRGIMRGLCVGRSCRMRGREGREGRGTERGRRLRGWRRMGRGERGGRGGIRCMRGWRLRDRTAGRRKARCDKSRRGRRLGRRGG